MVRRRKVQPVTRAGKSAVQAGRDDHGRGRNHATILGAVIGATAAIIAAVIMKPADPAPAQHSEQPKPAATAPASTAPSIQADVAPPLPARQEPNQITNFSIREIDGSHLIVVWGFLNRLGQPGDLYAVAAPREADPTRSGPGSGRTDTSPNDSRTDRVYFSPAIVNPDGSWEARLKIDPTDTRELTVGTLFLPPCNLPPMNNPLCDVRGPSNSGVHPDPSAGTPTQPRLTTPANPANPPLGPRGVGPVGPLGKDGSIDPPQILGSIDPPDTKRINVKEWLERNGAEVAWAMSDPTTSAVPHP